MIEKLGLESVLLDEGWKMQDFSSCGVVHVFNLSCSSG